MALSFRRFTNKHCIGLGITIDYGYFKGIELHCLFWTFDLSIRGKWYNRRIQRIP
jgi:hypothetical protein